MELAEISDAELVEQVTTWAGRVAAGEARLLALVGELDAREAWAVHGVRSCAHWLSWRIGWTPGTALFYRLRQACRACCHHDIQRLTEAANIHGLRQGFFGRLQP